jgi:hypothetical protein
MGVPTASSRRLEFAVAILRTADADGRDGMGRKTVQIDPFRTSTAVKSRSAISRLTPESTLDNPVMVPLGWLGQKMQIDRRKRREFITLLEFRPSRPDLSPTVS